jgi:antitoxin (DNA-binding transcriptional repressor) of toxin-antitoxin stability system
MDMTTTDLSEAKAHLSLYGRRAEAGESTLVLKHRRPAFVIAPVPVVLRVRIKKPGLVKGKIQMAADFDHTPADLIAAFEGSA